MRIFYPEGKDFSPLEIPNRTIDKDEIYAAIGRALTLASCFEASCKTVYFCIKAASCISDNRPDISTLLSENELDEIAREASKRNLNKFINEILQAINQEEGGAPSRFLHDAREARNFIAHELTINLDFKIVNEEERGKLFALLQEKIKKISMGIVFLTTGYNVLTQKTPLKEDEAINYLIDANNWIFRTYALQADSSLRSE